MAVDSGGFGGEDTISPGINAFRDAAPESVIVGGNA